MEIVFYESIYSRSPAHRRKYLPTVFFFLSGVFVFFIQPAFSATYFQQEVAYSIQVVLNDQKHELSAYEEVKYTNHSQDTLRELYFHLWPNAYRNSTTALYRQLYSDANPVMLESEEHDLGYIDSLDFRVDQETIQWTYLKDTIDICKLRLNRALVPGASIVISTPFHVKIPDASISRLGHQGQAYYITQWYPKPAVYDINGWNYFSYLDRGEFYSEFGSFDVSITLPSNYVVGATGNLDASDPEWQFLNSLAARTDTIQNFPDSMEFPPSTAQTKTLRYRQDRIHDFAWFADKRYHVLKGEVELPGSGRKVTTWSLFTNAEAELWKRAPEYLRNGLYYNSLWIGEYPYEQVTAVDVLDAAGGGMEYPMITAIGSYGSAVELDVTIFHEVGHNWYYGILGSNERLHPWLDEGLANFYETRYMYTHYPHDSARQAEPYDRFGKAGGILGLKTFNHRSMEYFRYLWGARQNSDQSPDLSAEKYDRTNYSADVYRKSALGLDYMLTVLGDSLFDACMHAYFDQWKFKHPAPADLYHVFSGVSGKDLSWFFETFQTGTGKLNYSICGTRDRDHDSITVQLKNTAQTAAPLYISSIKDQQSVSRTLVPGFAGKREIRLACPSCDALILDAAGRMPELYRNDNKIRTQGLLRKTEKVRFNLLPKLETAGLNRVFVTPVVGWNQYNGFMPGATIYNVFTPEKRFEYYFTPLFATLTQDLTGSAELRYHFYPRRGPVQKITLQSGFRHFAYADDVYDNPTLDFYYSGTLRYSRSDNRIIFLFHPRNYADPVKRQVTLRGIYIHRDLAYKYFYRESTKNYSYFQAEYTRSNDNPLYAWRQHFNATFNNDFLKLFVETKNFLNYGRENKGMEIRFFGGLAFIASSYTPGVNYSMRLSGYNGTDDYLFDGVYPGRTETTGIWSQQFEVADAGFKAPTLFYRRANKWMIGANFSTSLPGLIPFRIFLDLGAFNDSKTSLPVENSISFDAGIELRVIKDIFVVYLPVLYSEDIRYVIDQEQLHLGNLIRFEFSFDKLSPLFWMRNIHL